MISKLHDFGPLEQRLREIAAPIIEFLERARDVDNGWPDRYKGKRLGAFNPDDFHLDFAFANPREEVGYTLDHSVKFSHLNEYGHGPFLELDVWIHNHSYNGSDASMSIKIHGDNTALFEGACHLLVPPPSRDVVAISPARHGFYGVYGMLEMITETYKHISGQSERSNDLVELARNVRLKHIIADQPDLQGGGIAPPRLNGH